MEAKKSPKANLDNKRSLFFQAGMLIVLLAVFLAFEWSSADKGREAIINSTAFNPIDEIVIPNTNQPDNTPPPPIAPQMSSFIEIVGNEIEIDMYPGFKTDDTDTPIFYTDYTSPSGKEEEIDDDDGEVPFVIVENKPKFNGHEEDIYFRNWVHSELVYPEEAIQNGVTGRVTVAFTIDTDGVVRNVKILRGADDSLNKEAIRVISSSPRWEPGRQRDKAVKVSYVFPVVFEIRR